jgi:hypothetical protein
LKLAARLRSRRSLPLLIGLLLLPVVAGTHTMLRVPVLYRRVELPSREPVVLELDFPAADFQIEPASLGYFVDSPGGARQFVYTADVPRGLLYAQLPGSKPPGAAAAGPGSVVVLELAAPSGEVFFDDQLGAIRDNVAELNRRRNLLKQAQDGAHGVYRTTLKALWKELSATAGGIRANGWLDGVLAKYPQDIPRIAVAVTEDARQRAEQKALFYGAEQQRLQLLLSQYDLQLGLARVPHRRSAELLSLGDEKLVKATVLHEIDRVGRGWDERRTELQSLMGPASAQLQRLTDDHLPEQQSKSASLAASLDPRNLVVVPPDSGLTTDTIPPRQALERAIVNGWLTVQQRELNELEASLPLIDSARKHVNASDAPDWSSLPRYTVAAASFQAPALESLRFYAALDAGVQTPAVPKLLGGLARQFETPADATGPGRLPDIFNAQQQSQAVLNGLQKATLNVAPDEVAYGLLALERCTSAAQAPAAPAGAIDVGGPPAAAPATAKTTDGEQDVALRAAVVGQLDLILRSPDDSGLAAYDLAYLKFMRWYAALSLPELVPADSATPLATQSYGFKAAVHVP